MSVPNQLQGNHLEGDVKAIQESILSEVLSVFNYIIDIECYRDEGFWWVKVETLHKSKCKYAVISDGDQFTFQAVES